MFFKSPGVKELQRISVNSSTVDVYQAWTSSEVTTTIETILTDWSNNLPKDVNAKIVIKPNLNNDLVALTGNCTDLRVLWVSIGYTWTLPAHLMHEGATF